MKPLLTILFIIFSLNSYSQKQRTFTVTYINREDSIKEVVVRWGFQYWKAECDTIPETLKRGDKMVATFSRTKDSCNCFFKRIR